MSNSDSKKNQQTMKYHQNVLQGIIFNFILHLISIAADGKYDVLTKLLTSLTFIMSCASATRSGLFRTCNVSVYSLTFSYTRVFAKNIFTSFKLSEKKNIMHRNNGDVPLTNKHFNDVLVHRSYNQA